MITDTISHELPEIIEMQIAALIGINRINRSLNQIIMDTNPALSRALTQHLLIVYPAFFLHWVEVY
jgi:hypothetical protein